MKIITPHPIIVAILCTALFTGCATRPPRLTLRQMNASQVGPVSCEFDPAGKERAKYWSAAAQADLASGGGGGLAGLLTAAAMAGISSAGGQSQLDAVTKATGAFERPLLMSEVEPSMKGAGFSLQSGAPAKLSVRLIQYGLYKNFNEMAVAIIDADVELRDSTGRRIWRGQVRGTSANANKLKDYAANPELYRQGILSAATSFSQSLLDTPDYTVLAL
jgi:hypothetical protein